MQYIKERDKAKTYLLLKDIFPQNAVDLSMMTTTGIKSIIYKYFSGKEKTVCNLDHVGCMSQANVDYVLKHNPKIPDNKIKVCPNSIEVQDFQLSGTEKAKMCKKCGIPAGKIVFVYGGNLGKPQGIPFIIECLKTQEQNPKAFFLIVGDGTEFGQLKDYVDKAKPVNMKLMQRLPKDDYDWMIAACDVGLIFLDHRFTIPNFSSRLLAYMQAGLPVLAVTDNASDVGQTDVENGFGFFCESNDYNAFGRYVDMLCNVEIHTNFRGNAHSFLLSHYTVQNSYKIIMEHLK